MKDYEVERMKYKISNGWFHYPNETSQRIENWGILETYIGKEYTRKEIDVIICEMIMKHPYIDGCKCIEINIEWINERTSRGYYQMLKLTNDNYKKQDIYNNEIKYEI